MRAERMAAWHFCRHDDKKKSAPPTLLRSLSAMLCHRLPGYEAALGEVPSTMLSSTDLTELSEALLLTPLSKVAPPTQPMLIIIDALDEIPKQEQKPLLDMITKQLVSLPPWLRLFVTSREEPQIQRAFVKFKPTELRADETKTRADVEIKLRKMASKHVKGNLSMEVLAAGIKKAFGVDMGGRLVLLQEKMDESIEIYMDAITAIKALPGFIALLDFDTRKPPAHQVSKEFAVVYKQAVEAQAILTSKVATEWELLPTPLHPETGQPFMRQAVPGKTTKPWIEMVDDPGVKGEARAKAKVDNDYGGDASQLKDLARLTLRFTSPAKLAEALCGLEKELGFKIIVLKNK